MTTQTTRTTSVRHLIAALAATEDELRELRGLPLDESNRESVRAISQRRADIIHELRGYHMPPS